MIELKSVNKIYTIGKAEVPVLNNINLQVKKGYFLSIMGPSGSGKSTLLNILGCLDQPTNGDYWLNGKLVSKYDDKQLARVRNHSIGLVFQQFHLLPRLNAYQNVELPLIYSGQPKLVRHEKVINALDKMGLSNRINYFPNELSGGQQQRVAIARAIVNNPSLILADEPTGSLDSNTSNQIMNIFSLLNEEGTTVVIVTHDPDISAHTNLTLVVRDGLLTHDEILEETGGV